MATLKKEMGAEGKNITKQILELRWQHFEQRRQEKLKILLEERQVIMNEEASGAWVPQSQSKIMQAAGSYHSSHGKRSAVAGSKMISGGSSGGVVDSAMLERERQTLEKIKQKQVTPAILIHNL